METVFWDKWNRTSIYIFSFLDHGIFKWKWSFNIFLRICSLIKFQDSFWNFPLQTLCFLSDERELIVLRDENFALDSILRLLFLFFGWIDFPMVSCYWRKILQSLGIELCWGIFWFFFWCFFWGHILSILETIIWSLLSLLEPLCFHCFLERTINRI